MLDREKSARESKDNNRKQSRKRKTEQTRVTDGKTGNRQRSVGHMLMQGEVYISRGRKGNIREQSRKRERTD